MKGLHLFIYGKVQGVFFRKSTQTKAVSLNVAGWVRNRKDGRVEVYAQGSEDALVSLLQWCGKGPKLAKVNQVDTKWIPSINEVSDFEIRQTV